MTSITPWRDDKEWLHCHVCGSPIATFPHSPRPHAIALCYSCTGHHPHILMSEASLPDYLDSFALRFPAHLPHYPAIAERIRNVLKTRSPLQLALDLDLDLDIDL